MHYVDLNLLIKKVISLEEHDEERIQEKEIRMENLFYDVVCVRNNISQCEDITLDDMLWLLENLTSIMAGEGWYKSKKNIITQNIMEQRCHRKRRLI